MAQPWEPFTHGFSAPPPALAPYVQFFLDIRIGDFKGLAHPAFFQPPESALAVLFHYGTKMRVRAAAGGDAPMTLGSQVVGIHDFSWAIEACGAAGIVAANLTPLGAACFQGGPAGQFAGRRIPLADVFGDAWVRSVEDDLWNTHSEVGRVARASQALQDILVPHGQDDLASWAAARIAQAHGQMRIDLLATQAGVSERQLERRFSGEYGFGPKRLGRILRLRNAMSLVRGAGSSLADVAAAAGFSDQAHLAREFQGMLGTSPKDLRSAGQPENARHT